MNCFRCFFSITNTLLLLVGGGMIAASVLAFPLVNEMDAVGVSYLKTGLITFLCIGAFMIIFAFIGTITICSQGKCLLSLYAVATLLLALIFLAAGIGLLVYEEKIQTHLKSEFGEEWGKSMTSDEGRSDISKIEKRLECCGWSEATPQNSACSNDKLASADTCKHVVDKKIEKFFLPVTMSCFILAAISLLFLVTSCGFRTERSIAKPLGDPYSFA